MHLWPKSFINRGDRRGHREDSNHISFSDRKLRANLFPEGPPGAISGRIDPIAANLPAARLFHMPDGWALLGRHIDDWLV